MYGRRVSWSPEQQGILLPTRRTVSTNCLQCIRRRQQGLIPHSNTESKEKPIGSQHGVVTEPEQDAGVRIALKMLRFYKTAISPLLPPSCRFLPTCSSYAMEAYSEYGVGKGTIMTAWRLFRCTPWGDSGYDPPVWPPKGLAWLERKE